MKSAMKTRSISPPVHVHVDDNTRVHVHVKSVKTPEKSSTNTVSSRPTAKVKTRLPWIPPGRASTREATFKWEGPSHRLQITPPLAEATSEHAHSELRLADLRLEEETGIRERVSQYERKIDSLMTEVNSLRNEVVLRKKEQLLERQSEQLDVSHQVIAVQEEELAEVTKELEETERENLRLRYSMEKMREDADFSREEDKDALLRKLVEVEVDGAAAAKQVSALRESVSKLCAAVPSRLCGSESLALVHDKEVLLQKLKTFEATNQTLRELLREQHDNQMESIQHSDQKDALLNRLAETEAENANLVVMLQEKEKEVNQLSALLDAERINATSSTNISKNLESTRSHLQGQLRSKQAQNSRLTVQIKNLEQTGSKQKVELDHLKQQLHLLEQQAAEDREALKKATRAQKQRAERSEGVTGQLSKQLQEMEKQVADAMTTAENWQKCHAKETKEKNKLEAKLSQLNIQAAEVKEQISSGEVKSRTEREALLDRLHELTKDNTAAKLENQSLKDTAAAVEEKLVFSQSELQHVKASIKQYQSLMDSYKMQLEETRAEADEYCAQLTRVEQETQVMRSELEKDLESVRRELVGRLAELEPLPETLRCTELQLQEAQERARSLERRGGELSTTLTDLRMKMETQGSQMELVRQKNKGLLEENRQLQNKVENLERKRDECDSQNTELLAIVTKRDETIHSNQIRLDDKARECSLLSRKLEEALDDARQQISETRERAVTKERSTQAKMLELETQLSRTTSEVNQLRRSKEEVERRYQSRLQDVKDRLEQSDSTNRSLQNYVQFLKASYANVFGEGTMSSSLRASTPT